MKVSLPFECLNVAYQYKGLRQSNIVCEYEVNLSTNEKLGQGHSEGQCHNATCWWKGIDLSNSVCKYEVNPLTNDKVITEIQNNVKCQGHLKVNIIMLHVYEKVLT